MSVINQVLLELEKRRASGQERGTLPDHVRTLPEGGNDKGGWWLAMGSAAAVGLLIAVWLAVNGYGLARQSPVAAAPLPGTEAVIEKVVAAAETAVAAAGSDRPAAVETARPILPAARLSLELSRAPAPQPIADQQSVTVKTPGLIPAARVLAQAGAQSGSGAPAETATAPVVSPSGAVYAPHPPAPARSAAHTAAADKPSAGAGAKSEIDKQLRHPSARELADHEYRKASTLLQQGRPAEAQEGFRAALGLHPAHHAARQAMVALMLQGKQYGEAERALQDGLKLAPEQTGFAMTLARLQVDRGDTAGAIATLQASAAHAPGNPDYLAFLAALLQRQGRHEEAIEKYSTALRGKPNTGVWWLGMGISLQAANRGAEAQEAYRRAKAGNINPELAAYADQRLRQLQ